jgi:hypothetical protein
MRRSTSSERARPEKLPDLERTSPPDKSSSSSVEDSVGIGDWGLGIGPNPQSPIPIPNPKKFKNFLNLLLVKIQKLIKNTLENLGFLKLKYAEKIKNNI